MWTIIEGNCFERFSGAAIDSPSRMASRASSTTFSSTTLFKTRLTISSAVSTGTPAASIVEKRAREARDGDVAREGPEQRQRSLSPSTVSRPLGLATQRRKAQ